jgi:hypothetical protein
VPPLVLIHWEDASVVDDDTWVQSHNMPAASPVMFQQVGWLLEMTKEHVVLSACIGADMMSARDRIPRGMVRSITVFDPMAGQPYKAPRRRKAKNDNTRSP